MSDDVTKWLEGLGFGQYAKAFEEGAIDWEVLPSLDHEILKELGVKPPGHRLKILNAIQALGRETTTEVSPSPTEAEAESATSLRGEAERRQLTVMFCDLVGSTELSQRLDPEDLREVNRAYQDACTSVIERYEGYVARYMGDGVLAYFGYPQAHEDDAERSIHAGLAIVDSMVDLNDTLGKRQRVELGVRVGIATGAVVVGDLIGEGSAQESAVVGETPNLAARLQNMASNNSVVIGPRTQDLAGGRFEYEDLGKAVVKGMAEPVQAWRVVAANVTESRFEALHTTGVTPLVGRQHEIGLLLERWGHVKAGDGQVVCLSGEPGIGKSRISETLLERTAADDPIRLRYQCSAYHVNSALHPIISQLERAAGFEKADSSDVRLEKLESLLSQGTLDIATVLPLFASMLSVPAGGRYRPLDMSPERQKEALLEALVSQVEGLSAIRPILLIFEDVHWVDPTSLEWLEIIVGRVQRIPALAVITFRPEFSSSWGGHSHVTSLVLNRFSRGLATEMIDKVAGGKRLPGEVCEEIIAKTDGVPLFVEELARAVIESTLLEDRGDHYGLASSLSELAIPGTLHDSLMARLDRLTPAVREVAQMASVIGRGFSYEVLNAVSTLASNELRDALDKLIETTLIFRQGAGTEGGYVFKHALVRDAAYESLLRRKRRSLHGRIAKVLESEFSEITETEPEVLAQHYTEAGLTDSALKYWLRAGESASKHGTYTEAISHLERGLALIETLTEGEVRDRWEISFRVTLGVPLLNAEGVVSMKVAANYARARTLCEALDESEQDQLFPILWGLWFHKLFRGELRPACELADRLLEIGVRQDDVALELTGHHCQWASRCLVGDLAASLEHGEQGIELYRADIHHALTYTYGGHDPGTCARNITALALLLSGYPVQGRARSNDALELAHQLGHSTTLMDTQFFAVVVALFNRDTSALERHAQAMLAFVESERQGNYEPCIDVANSWALFEQGELKAALIRVRAALESLLGSRDAWHSPLFTYLVANIGRYESRKEAMDLLNEELMCTQRNGARWWEAELYRTKGDLLLIDARGNTTGAEDCYRQAIDVAQSQGARSLELRSVTALSRLWQSQGKRNEARDLLVPLCDWFTEGLDTPDLKEAKVLLEQLA